MATHSSILAWAIPCTRTTWPQGNRLSCRDQEGRRGSEEAVPGTLVFPSGEPGVSGDLWGSQDTGEGNGTPLQYFCLENPMDRGAW